MHRPFIIYALPRSRTAWLARFLTYRNWTCLHETAITLRWADDIPKLFSIPRLGTAETAASLAWRLLDYHVPNLRRVVVRRPVDDVVRAMIAAAPAVAYDEAILRAGMNRGRRALDEIATQPGVLTVDFADLDRPETCAAVFTHCLPFRFDRAWWDEWRGRSIQADVGAVLRYYQANRDRVEAFKVSCKAELRRLAYAGLINKQKSPA